MVKPCIINTVFINGQSYVEIDDLSWQRAKFYAVIEGITLDWVR